ncbi:acetolactate synthase large subunit [Bradyrhizobium pachyrhizi]|uniref:Acetolactate synthase large subunit n=1 Tax=Bradyrhizobium pachyrhizi TaxID=280333 RepID=A0A844SCD5_9BRAD|nr:acetolactate synthase large subunit [Bradyrhizobium pachyrhizi]MVT64903.1 acetolactate synthase large subunit [Bradyrhizobium pachyrhizi]
MIVSDLLVKCLEAEGVRYIFGVPGEETEDLLFSLEGSSITFVPCRHEQGAAFIADVWGRLTGDAGVCLSTLGPGATNLMTAVADATLDKAPLVAITAQGGLDRLHHESHQRLDIVRMFAAITKWNGSIYDPRVLPEIVRNAFKLAEMEKPGATHIELAEDVARIKVPEALQPICPRVVRRPDPDEVALEEALSLLRRARRPLMIAGNGAIREHASKQLSRLANDHGIPVVATFMGKGAISDRSPQSLICIGTGFKDYVREAVEIADLVIALGYDIAEYAPERWNPLGDKAIVHIDVAPAEVYGRYQAAVEVVGDVNATLRDLNGRLDKDPLTLERDWYKPVRERILSDIASYDLRGLPFTIPGALNLIRKVLPDDGLLISDVGSHKVWIARNFPTYCPNGCLISNGLAAMGIALPGGIAAALAQPGRAIVAAMGDGGFLMNSQELETARRLGAGYTVVVFNDNDYGLISWKQSMSHGRSTGTRISNPDFRAYAESFGIRSYRPGSVDELREALSEAIDSRELRLIEIPVDPSVNRALVEKLARYWDGKE